MPYLLVAKWVLRLTRVRNIYDELNEKQDHLKWIHNWKVFFFTSKIFAFISLNLKKLSCFSFSSSYDFGTMPLLQFTIIRGLDVKLFLNWTYLNAWTVFLSTFLIWEMGAKYANRRIVVRRCQVITPESKINCNSTRNVLGRNWRTKLQSRHTETTPCSLT